MTGYGSGELFWDTAEATARRWVLLLDGPPGVARRRLDPQDPSTPQAASASQLRELIRRAFHEDTGHWPVSVTLAMWAAELAGKIVVIDDVATGSSDIGPIPLDANFPLSGLHANAMHTILTEQFLRELSPAAMFGIEAALLVGGVCPGMGVVAPLVHTRDARPHGGLRGLYSRGVCLWPLPGSRYSSAPHAHLRRDRHRGRALHGRKRSPGFYPEGVWGSMSLRNCSRRSSQPRWNLLSGAKLASIRPILRTLPRFRVSPKSSARQGLWTCYWNTSQ
jgi:hypothetical protein